MHPRDGADRASAATKVAAQDFGINPRTGKPYKRGPYETKPPGAKTGVAALKAEVKGEQKQLVQSAEEIKKLKTELKDSKAEVMRLTEAVAAAKSATALEVAKARADVKAEMQSDM